MVDILAHGNGIAETRVLEGSGKQYLNSSCETLSIRKAMNKRIFFFSKAELQSISCFRLSSYLHGNQHENRSASVRYFYVSKSLTQ